jgi:hypothetical protein
VHLSTQPSNDQRSHAGSRAPAAQPGVPPALADAGGWASRFDCFRHLREKLDVAAAVTDQGMHAQQADINPKLKPIIAAQLASECFVSRSVSLRSHSLFGSLDCTFEW